MGKIARIARGVKIRGIKINPYFTTHAGYGIENIRWDDTKTEIKDSNGQVIFSKQLEVPSYWSPLAAKVVASKYLLNDKKEINETSVKQLVSRVGETIAYEAVNQGLIEEGNREIYAKELMSLTAGQYGSFNSPVWFNEGLFRFYGRTEKRAEGEPSFHWAYDFKTRRFTNYIDAYERPQNSACFIQSVEDTMESILAQGEKEGMLFKFGSGTGTNFSPWRGYGEPLSGGGAASGQISFMGFLDHIAKSVRSGGKTRRAAKMVISNCDHPDIFRFVQWKVNEERKALWLCANPEWAPRDAGDLESEAYRTVNGQNGNNSVRISDEFMNSVEEDKWWDLWFRTANRAEEEVEIPLDKYNDDRYLSDKRFVRRLTNKRKTVEARDLWDYIARAAYVTGDPAVQYDGTINRWNTCKASGRINASNPCSEFMFLDDSACNLASLRLTKFRNEDGSFDVDSFRKAVRMFVIAQEAIVDHSSYPSEKIARNSHNFRPLGLGYTDMGALLMSWGIPYDSDSGRAIASYITAIMTGEAYRTSAEIAGNAGAFPEFEKNRKSMLEVMAMHVDALKKIDGSVLPEKFKGLEKSADEVWRDSVALGEKNGYRNAQVTLLAPTGTIGFMMDCDTTGIEPMIFLKSSKGLVGGGKIDFEVAKCVKQGLESLGYTGETLEGILGYIDDEKKGNGRITGAPGLREEHYSVFATSLGDNVISVDGHLNMMAAIQPFLSGAISKTVNLPKGSSLDDIKKTYEKGWKLGLKSVALYVDCAKGVQPITVEISGDGGSKLKWGERLKPEVPTERIGFNVEIQGTGVHFIIGEYQNRKPCDCPADFFIEFGSSGSPLSAAYTSFAKELSRNRQRGEDLSELIKHQLGAVGVVAGLTDHPFIRKCTSIEDFLARLIKLEYLGQTDHCQVEPTPEQMKKLRCNVLARRKRQEHFLSRIESIDAMMERGEVVPVIPLLEDDVPSGMIRVGTPFCVQCGTRTVLSGASCYKCPNCGDASLCG